MLELPEALVCAGQLNGAIKGKRVSNVIANKSPHKFAFYSGDPGHYPLLLTGKVVGDSSAYGGRVEIAIGEMVLATSAMLRYYSRGERLPLKHQLLLEFSDGTSLVGTVQMWASLFCFKAGESSGLACHDIAKQRPSPLSDEFDREFFERLLDDDSRKLSAKAFLATEQRIPGLGNGVLQDILYNARIHPRRQMASLSGAEVDAMYRSVKSTLREMVSTGGRDTEKDIHGTPGGYKTKLSSATAGTSCSICGESIRKEQYLGGSIYYCGGCQSI